MRVLHLLDAPDASIPHTRLAMLALSMGRLPDAQEDLCLLGNADLQDAATALNLRPRWRLHTTGKMAASACFSLRRAIRLESFDLIHCWSTGRMGPATLAMLAASGTPRIVTVTQSGGSSLSHWARFFSSEAPSTTTYLPISESLGRELVTGGVAPEHVQVLRPGLDMGMVAHHDRPAIRASWKATPRTLVVMIVSDPADSVNCVDAQMAAGLADQILRDKDMPVKLIVHPRQEHIGRSLAACRQIGRPDLLTIDSRISCPWQILPGADIALAMGEQGGGLGLLWAMAANVPIVGEANYAISELVEDRHSALLAKPGIPKALTHRILQIAGDKQLAWKLKDTARHEAYSLYSRAQYVQSLSQVYQQIVSHEPVNISPPASTGGLRFAGRA